MSWLHWDLTNKNELISMILILSTENNIAKIVNTMYDVKDIYILGDRCITLLPWKAH